MPDLPPPGTHASPAADAKEWLAGLTGWPPEVIGGYAYMLIGHDGTPICFGGNGHTREALAAMLRQMASEAEKLEDWPDA